MKYFPIVVLCFLISFATQAQEIIGLGTKWNDEFREWVIYTDDEDIEGEIKMRWQMRDDWSEWDYDLEDYQGTIKQKWKTDPSFWEIRGETIASAKMLWKGDASEWRITDNSKTLTLRSRYRNDVSEWSIREDHYGEFEMWAQFQGDPREWNVYIDLDDEISFEMRLLMVFIVAYHSSPRI